MRSGPNSSSSSGQFTVNAIYRYNGESFDNWKRLGGGEMSRKRPSCYLTASALAALIPLMFLVACAENPADQLAVARLSPEEIQSTEFLPLNDDLPGFPVDAERYLIPGKFNIVFFYSPYDAESIRLSSGLARLPQIRENIAVRTVNINREGIEQVDWQSPLVQECRINSLPYVRIYEPRLNLRAQGRPALEQLKQWIIESENTLPLNQ